MVSRKNTLGVAMSQSLQSRKQNLVHDAIYEAAIDLFMERGFEETTVEEIAQASGISRRSFFRYFASKDDLLAQSVVNNGTVIVSAIQSCPEECEPLRVVRETVLEALKYAASQPRARQVIAISERSPGAAQAHLSRMVDVEVRIAEAFAARMKGVTWDGAEALLLAGLTTLVTSSSIVSWAHGECPDMTSTSQQAFQCLSELFSSQDHASSGAEPTLRRKSAR
jgi:AcrR family transcriptional regulator